MCFLCLLCLPCLNANPLTCYTTQDDWRGFHAKVSDFGLSKLLPESHLQVKDKLATDDVAGTITHMSPELLSGGSMSAAADVYAFGILSKPFAIFSA